jgi:hypothetical protein
MHAMPPQSASTELRNLLHITYQMQTQLNLSITKIQDLEHKLQTQNFDHALDNRSMHTEDAATLRINSMYTAQIYTSPSSSHS